MSFAKDFERFAKLTNASLDETGRAIALELFSGVIKDTPVDTGRARGNWQASIGAPETGQIAGGDESKTETPAPNGDGPKTAEAIRAVDGIIDKFGMGKVIYLSNNLPYIYRLEFMKWSDQAPAGMVRKNAARIQANIRKAVAENKV